MLRVLVCLCACRYYLSWRNACLNGVGLRDAAVAQLQGYAVPPTGSLKLDYVSYQVKGTFTLSCIWCCMTHAQLHGYAVPPTGSLKLDYVSYQVRCTDFSSGELQETT